MTDVYKPSTEPTVRPAPDAEWAARREVAEATRRLIENLVTCTSDVATLQAVAEAVRREADRLAAAPRLFGRKAFEEAAAGRYGTGAMLGYELNPLDGKCNPLAPPFTLWVEGDVAHARVTLGWQYEGPPATAHGGYVCALFDQFLGMAQLMTDQPGVTGMLTTWFHRPTPLCTELSLVGRVKEVKGRRNVLTGEIWANGVMTASCEGLFIYVSKERFRQLRDGGGGQSVSGA